MGHMEESRGCTHTPLTTLHLSISWCTACRRWSLRFSQSGRRDTSGAVVLIEHLRTSSIAADGYGPDEVAAWVQRALLWAAQELEEDRRDTDLHRRHLRLID